MSRLLGVAALATAGGIGGIAEFAHTTNRKCSGHLWWRDCVNVAEPISNRLIGLLIGIGALGFAVACVLGALFLFVLSGKRRQYSVILKGAEVMSVQKIAEITGSHPGKVRDDLQSMIDSEMITDVYINYGADQVVSKRFIPERSHKTVVKCSECGGNNDVIVGITRDCGFCGQPLLLGPQVQFRDERKQS